MLTPGTRLGAYEILSLVGAGGMGEVYRARDPRLRRDVAVKVLPAGIAADGDRLRRFEHEAQAAGQLNHPNILVVHDVGSHDGCPYLVSELLDGENLRQRLEREPLRVPAAIEILTQVARGLRAAHESGVVHRDLKPENVFLTRDGGVKILDFGLAKLVTAEDVSATAATVTGQLTRVGTVMGTAGYMSPEQVRGEAADHRSDIFAFGALMFEMLTGRRAFQGKSDMDVMSDILRSDAVDVAALQPEVPPALARIAAHCLEKSQSARFQSTADLCFALEALTSALPTPTNAPATGKNQRRSRYILAACAAVGAVATATLWVALAGRQRSNAPDAPFVASVAPPSNLQFGSLIVSPDGRRVAFTASDGGATQLWTRTLDQVSPVTTAIKATEGATNPFWSPDSRSIGFFAGNQLKIVDVDGGTPRQLSDVGNNNRGGAWSRNGTIVFAPDFAGPLYRIGQNGTDKRQLTQLDASRHETTHRWPHFLPDGQHFVYFARATEPSHVGIYVGALDGATSKYLAASTTDAVFAPPGYLLFIRDGVLLAQPFDQKAVTLTGEARSLLPEVGYSLAFNRGSMSVSETGVLVYGALRDTQPVWFDRRGNSLAAAAPAGDYGQIWLSPDDARIVTDRPDRQTGANDIYVVELQRGGSANRLTSDPASDTRPIWLADERIVWGSNRSGVYELFQLTAGEGARPEPLLQSGESTLPIDGSPDGRFLLFSNAGAKSKTTIRVLPLTGDRTPFPLLASGFNETQARFSSDGRWIAYSTDKDGETEIYIAAARSLLPTGGSRPPQSTVPGRRVSTSGGAQPVWRRDGKRAELFFLSSDRHLMAVTIGSNGEPGVPQPLFRTGLQNVAPGEQDFDVSRDGERFLIRMPVESRAGATVVFNWLAALAEEKRR